MALVPSWFERELACIDPSYFVVWNDLYRYYEIKRKMDFKRTVEIEGGATSDGRGHGVVTEDKIIKIAMHNPTVAVFKILNDAALTDLRQRKYMGLKFHRAYRDDEFLKWIARENREAKAKKEELARELIATGFMEMHRLERRHTVNGSTQHDESGASVGSP